VCTCARDGGQGCQAACGRAVEVEQCDVILVSFETLRDELRKTSLSEGGLDMPLGALGFWRIILDEAQLVSQTTSRAALMCSDLWRRHAWVATGKHIRAPPSPRLHLPHANLLALRPARTWASGVLSRGLLCARSRCVIADTSGAPSGTPINAKAAELHGLLAFLGTAPFKEVSYSLACIVVSTVPLVNAEPGADVGMGWQEAVFNKMLLQPYKEREASALYRMRTLLRALCMRRSKLDPVIAAQIALPPLSWETRLLRLSEGEQAVYAVAAARFRQSQQAFNRLVGRRPQQQRNQAGGKGVQARLLGQLNGDLTRLRQTACHASVVNEARAGAGGRERVHAADGSRLPQALVVARIVANAAAERDAAHCAFLKARVLLHLARQRASGAHGAAAAAAAAGEVLQELEECETASAREAEAEADGDASRTLGRNLERWRALRIELLALLGLPGSTGGGKPGTADDVTDETRERRLLGRTGKRRAEPSAAAAGAAGDDRGRGGKKAKGCGAGKGGDAAELAEAARAVQAAESKYRTKESSHKYLNSLRPAPGGGASSDGKAAARDHKQAKGGGEEEDGATDGEAEEKTCPICLEGRGEGGTWALTVCGHAGCFECLTAWLAEQGTKTCPVCKGPLTVQGLFEVEEAEEEAEAAAPLLAAAASAGGSKRLFLTDDGMKEAAKEYGTKVAALVQELGAVHAAGGKAVVFSAWTRLLKLAGAALEAHGLPTASLVGSPAAKRDALEAFSAHAAVLLVPLFGGASGAGGGGAAGLTLTQASVAVLLEPALQPGIERQAAGRIARIGQVHDTRCIRLIVDESIETKILRWQRMRLADGAAASNSLSLNDFAALVE